MAGVDDLTREGSPGLEHAISSSNVSESTLHFEDVDEFPDLLSAGRGYLPGEECGGADRATLSGTSLSYSDVIKAVSTLRHFPVAFLNSKRIITK